MKQYTIGIDFGSLSGRTVLMDAESGEICCSSVYEYPHAIMTEQLPDGTKLPPDTALQHPDDYVQVLRHTIPEVIKTAGISAEKVQGIGIDFTGCTMLPLNADMQPLCLDQRYASRPHAYVKLWKHHAAQKEADDLNRIAIERKEVWLQRYGGKVSAEWMFPKIWQILREDPDMYTNTERFMEAADWISWLLTGKESHSASFVGYKALWHETDGFPNNTFFSALDPRLASLVGTKFSDTVTTLQQTAGTLSVFGAELTGLRPGIPVAVPLLDAHASMPALGITEPGTLMLILGTSGVQLVHAEEEREIPGICGVVKGGIIPGLYTYEAGQASCGDQLEWFLQNGVPGDYEQKAKSEGKNMHRFLSDLAKSKKPGESGLLALDWFNGNRSVLSDSSLRGMILGLTLRTKPEDIYRALIEGIAYGSKMILDTIMANGIPVKQVIASGGIAEKNEMFMQIYADIFNYPILVSNANMSAARGSAVYATVAAGIYSDIHAASKALAVNTGKTYTPIPQNAEIYHRLYEEYRTLHDYFGKGKNHVMKRLDSLQKRSI